MNCARKTIHQLRRGDNEKSCIRFQINIQVYTDYLIYRKINEISALFTQDDKEPQNTRL